MIERSSAVCVRALALGATLIHALSGCASGTASGSGQTVRGAEILDHPCGKVSVEYMGLVHQGRMDEAAKLGTPELQKEWRALPAAEREAMSGMMTSMSQSAPDFAADIADHGQLTVTGSTAALTVKKSHRDSSGSSTETFTQYFEMDGLRCAVAMVR